MTEPGVDAQGHGVAPFLTSAPAQPLRNLQDQVLAHLDFCDPAPATLLASFPSMLQQHPTPCGFLTLLCSFPAWCLCPCCSFGLKLETKNTLTLAMLLSFRLLLVPLEEDGRVWDWALEQSMGISMDHIVGTQRRNGNQQDR